VRRFLRCASGAGGRPCQSAAARTGWHGVLAQRTPPHKNGGEAETRAGSGAVTGCARAAKLAEPE